jgi:hypothetical protein
MLDIKKILKRSWQILWSYRMLWAFGFILALTVGGGGFNRGGGSSSSNGNDGNQPNNNRPFNFQPGDDWSFKGLKGETPREKLNDALSQAGAAIQKLQAKYPVEFRMGIAVAVTVLIMILIFSFIGAILRYIAETATIRMVDEYEQSGVKVGFKQGWKYGWSSAAWRLFLINFIVHIPSLIMFVILGLIGWWIVSTALNGVESAIITSLIAGIGLAFIFGLLTALLMVVLYFLRDFAWRFSVLESTSVMESLRLATALVKRNWKSAGLMWLVMIGVKIAWVIVFFILVFPLLIVSILTAVGGLLVAVVPSLLTAGIASLLSAPDYWPWIFALVIGLPFFATVAFSPIALVRGWGLTYESSVWTLTYRELKALETVTSTVTE